MKHLLFALLLSSVCVFAEDAAANGDKLVTVPQKYVSSEGLQHQAAADAKVSNWIGIGREIGVATKEGLSAVINEAERFGTTRVGTFVMVMVAWKIVGHDALRIVFGIPIFIAGVGIWLWSYRRFFLTTRVLVKHDKTNRTKEYGDRLPYQFHSSDARATSAFFHGATLLVWCAAWISLIF